MMDLIIVSYPDADLNEYFEKCRNDLQAFILAENLLVTIHGEHGYYTKQTLEEAVKKFNDNYAVIIYAHGSPCYVVDHNKDIVLHEDQTDDYSKAVIYSTACSTAKSLGNKLQESGCHLFFGYYENSYALTSDAYIENIFIETDNYALKQLLNGTSDHQVLMKETDDFFHKKYLELKTIDYSSAALLKHNQEAARFYSNC